METFTRVSCFGVILAGSDVLGVCSHSCDTDHCAARPGAVAMLLPAREGRWISSPWRRHLRYILPSLT